MNNCSDTNLKGFTLLEVLVALGVLTIGLLGMASMQMFSLSTNHDAYMRTQATFLANSLMDNMRANRSVAMNGGYNIAFNSGPSSGNNCYSSTCSAVSLAQFDLNIWKCSLGKFQSNSICSSTLNVTPALSNGDGQVTRNGDEFTITVQWADSRNRADSSLPLQSTQVVMRL